MILQSSIKYNLLSFDELVINLDRLSRFKLPEESFRRVFCSIILKHLIFPKYSKTTLLDEDEKVISKLVKEIWNNSVVYLFGKTEKNYKPNLALKTMIRSTFKNIDDKTSVLIDTNLNISQILEKIDYDTAPLNIKFLIKANEINENTSYAQIREKYSLCFPVSKLLIVEGITEEILLPVFADKLNKNLDRNGVFVMGAGGKSKSPSLYMKLKHRLKIPVILLFDEDAKEICYELDNNLLKKDKYILIEKGEFEDILPENLIKRSLNKEYLPATPINFSELRQSNKMCENLKNFYRTRHLGEFKKSCFAKIIAGNIKYDTDITDEIKRIISCVI